MVHKVTVGEAIKSTNCILMCQQVFSTTTTPLTATPAGKTSTPAGKTSTLPAASPTQPHTRDAALSGTYVVDTIPMYVDSTGGHDRYSTHVSFVS